MTVTGQALTYEYMGGLAYSVFYVVSPFLERSDDFWLTSI
jgi:hypothetical protein